MKKLLVNFGDFLGKIFKFCFGRDDPEFEKAAKLDIASWHIISSPQVLPDGTISIFPYENKLVKSAILAIKRRNNTAIAEVLSIIVTDFLLEELSEMSLMNDFNNPLIVAIPISKKNASEKGFNHGDVIAEKIAKQLTSLEFLPRALAKTRYTEPQKNLTRTKRLTNLRHSMEVREKFIEKIKDRCVIVVDDVSTTGATLAEAKRALMSSGARKVLTVALAH